MDAARLIELAARVLDDRARNERNRSEQHKASGRHYKAREAAHVARIAEQDAARIRALWRDPETTATCTEGAP